MILFLCSPDCLSHVQARLFANIGSILMFAVVGTMISAVVMAVVTFGLTRLNEDLTQYGVLDFLIFGAIMSATDPVATLAIFGRQNADPTLFSLVFGESVLNDAVAITFFKYGPFVHAFSWSSATH